ncbi:uncharacterized protein DUF4402 [Jejuia pallidilutea]|uniref:Uncharacterized protein DUF4402 n=1 Tax=Jejuia pallidilutea TaxID=504487 RepID=A0A362X152_9FLAO|nr:DUF4402 domain-containing protein [Jejuia pallidilutea]PQV49473.1 uncharacterized protein DUF4402 [Jejuia pallidilutea]
MKKYKTIPVLFIILIACVALHAQTATGTSTASIVASISCTVGDTVLDFGAMSPDEDNPSTLTLTPASPTIATTGGGPNIDVYDIKPKTAAQFNVTGNDNATYSVVLPQSITLANLDIDGFFMTVTNFTSSLTSNSGTLVNGQAAFYVAATLNLAAGQPVGRYSGEFDVTVSYD